LAMCVFFIESEWLNHSSPISEIKKTSIEVFAHLALG
jgi:hypothetical protein